MGFLAMSSSLLRVEEFIWPRNEATNRASMTTTDAGAPQVTSRIDNWPAAAIPMGIKDDARHTLKQNQDAEDHCLLQART